MAYLFCRCLPAEARRRRQKLGGLGHAHFLYGRGVLNWAGGGASFLIPRSDAQGMRTIRRYLSDGPFPISLAPEGQVSYHNHRLGPIEGGTARLAVWCLEDLERQGREEEILIIPVACHYLYPDNPEQLFAQVVDRIIQRAGLQRPQSDSRYNTLIELTDQLLQKIEAFYSRFFTIEEQNNKKISLRCRIERVDLLEYIQPEYISPEASLNRLIEYALNLADLVNRAMGGDISFRYSPPKKRVQIRIEEPIKVRELFPLIPGRRRERAEGIMKVVSSRLESLSREE